MTPTMLTIDEIERRVNDSYELPNRVLEAVPEPLVTVRTSTYQHANFIRQCIEGVLMQKTTFLIEYIIGEDCSTDGTREIVFEYAQKYPDVIRVVTADYNVGAKSNSTRCRRRVRGKYTALCEGDDYWTDPLKLQKQVDFLQAHPECVICFHKVFAFHQEGTREPYYNPPPPMKKISSLEDLVIRNFVPTCSVVFRNGLVPDMPQWTHGLKMGDWPLFVLLAQHGKLGYLDDLMAAYRIHCGGAWSRDSEIERWHALIEGCSRIGGHLGPTYSRLIAASMSRLYYRLANAYSDGGEVAQARVYLKKSLVEFPFNPYINRVGLIALFGKLYLSGVHRILKRIQLQKVGSDHGSST